MAYYTIAQKIHGEWFPQFGDYDRATVKDELRDMRDHGIKSHCLRILRTESSQQNVIDDVMAQLNSPNVFISGMAGVPYACDLNPYDLTA